jgi:pimeloyl-ACP methyl ester carboxylesterase
MCDEALFADQVSHFSETRDVTVADFTRQSTIAAMASDILKYAPAKFCFAGLSMGGIVAFELYRQAPERIAALVLMNTTAYPDTPEKRANRSRQIKRARSGELTAMVLEELKPNYLSDRSSGDQDVLDGIVAMACRLGEQVFERQSRALMNRVDSRPTLARITCPVTLVAGDQDVLCPPALHSEMHQAIPNSKLHVLADCGHLSAMEKPAQVVRILEETLERIDTNKEKA